VIVDVAEWRPDILEEHAETLEALWNRRLRAERSAVVDGLALRRLDVRIDANVDALILAGGHASKFLEALLAGEEPHTAAAAANVIARTDSPPAIARLMEVLVAAAPEIRAGVWAALDLVAGPNLREALVKAAGDAEILAGTMAVLAAHEDPRAAPMQPERVLFDPLPAARTLGWKAVRRLGETVRVDPRYYQHGVVDADVGARRAALEAAIGTKQRGVLDHLRQVAGAPDLLRLEEHLMFAALAPAAEVPAVITLARSPVLGWERYRILAFCGRAPAVEELLAVMRGGDKVESALAGAAFYRITGVDATAGERVPLVPAGTEPDDFSDEIRLCDVTRAEKGWNKLKGTIAGARWAYGVDAETTPPESLPDWVDLESRWAADLRASFANAKRRLRFAHERTQG
jgi:hypothetical protein